MTDRHDSDAPGHADAVPDRASLAEPDRASGAEAHHEPTDHGDEHGHDDHAHGEEALGPIDVAAWGAGLLGLAVSVVIAACFVIATSVPA